MTGLIAATLLGACLGSFIATLAKRYENSPGSMVWGRSQCSSCQTALGPADLLPVLSWLFLRGRCRHCGARLDIFEPTIETIGMMVPLLAYAVVDDGEVPWLICVFGWWLLALAAIDLLTFLLPDGLTLSLLSVGLAMAVSEHPELPTIDQAVSGAIAGYILFKTLAFFYRWLRGRVGLGGGDAKLMAAIGAWVGITHLPMVLLVGSSLGLVYAALSPSRTSAVQAIPFGPVLALAAWAIFIGQALHAG